MEKTVSSQDAPGRFGDLLQGVSDKGDRYVVEQDGVPLAAVVPFALYSQWKGRSESLFRQMRETADRAGLSDAEALRREYHRVLAYPRLRVVGDGPYDDHFLACAASGGADCLVTGDPHLLNLGSYSGIPILSPADFLSRFFPE